MILTVKSHRLIAYKVVHVALKWTYRSAMLANVSIFVRIHQPLRLAYGTGG